MKYTTIFKFMFFIFVIVILSSMFLGSDAAASIKSNMPMVTFTILIIFILSFMIFLVIQFKKYSNNIKNIVRKGTRTEAYIDDYIYAKLIGYTKKSGNASPGWSSDINYFPVLRFLNKDGKEDKFIYTNTPMLKSSNLAKRVFEIGDKVDFYYIDRDQSRLQLSITEKIFMGDKYDKIKIISQDEATKTLNFSLYSEPCLYLYSLKDGDKISDYGLTYIKDDDAYIYDEKLRREGKKETTKNILILSVLALVVIIFLVYSLN